MPTPFYHLSIAEELLDHPGLQSQTRHLLNQNRCIFLFGNTAPDVQVVSRQPREATHFFTLPIQADSPPPWEQVLIEVPSLHCQGLSPGVAAFFTGYLCHLQADWLWIRDIFIPVFGPEAGWNTFFHRLYLHNVLRSYLDLQVLKTIHLDPSLEECLKLVEPDGWLPFVVDEHLRRWRDFVAQQLHPGAQAQTVEVFARRQGISPQEFYDLLRSEARMDQEVFSHLPRSQMDTYRQNLIEANIRLIQDYMRGSKHEGYRPDN